MENVGTVEPSSVVMLDQAPDYLSFLKSAAEEINSSIDYKTTLSNVARTMVPHLSDWCAVDIVDEKGTPKRVAIAHKDPAKIKIAQQLSDQYPPDHNAASGTPKVLRTGEPTMANGITDAMLKAAAKDEAHLKLMQSLEFHSLLIYPVKCRGKVLGTFTFVWTEHKRNYTLSDIAFVEVLSVIAGSAIENSRLLLKK